jgi:UDP-N-acetylmuramoyl-tripeptide--D-alanyl-D-alanine ligase
MRLSDAASETGARLIGPDREFAGCSTDSRNVAAGELFIALRGARHDGHDFVAAALQRGAGGALVDRVPMDAPQPLVLADDTRTALAALARAWRRRCGATVVAVTGSNGKTTVKEMIASIAAREGAVLATRGNLNNDIGVPLTLFGLGPEQRWAVIEMGANHPGEIALLCGIARPEVALITQCAPAHLEGFGSIDGVAAAKAEIYAGLGADGTAIINADDRYAGYWRGIAGSRRQLSFGFAAGATIRAERLHDHGGAVDFTLLTPQGAIDVRLPLPGRHNVVNALAACAAAEALGIAPASMKAGLEQMQPVKGRLQFRTGRAGTTLIDDTYNANPASLEAALRVLESRAGRRWLVLGDMGELGAGAADLHEAAGTAARTHGVERLYAVGPLGTQAVAAFGAGARHFADHASLIAALLADLPRGATILVKGSRAMRMEQVVAALGGD